ncbi:hypothetical protein [Streptomyces sp. NPDC005407]|uniref:hypothetical protein n=1 Tax=Streptomyces sp. NPDC005407 TaxID=3155340 RepID=UPI00339FDB7F
MGTIDWTTGMAYLSRIRPSPDGAAGRTCEGWSDGFRLSVGQDDEFPDVDTVPLAEGLRIARHILAVGTTSSRSARHRPMRLGKSIADWAGSDTGPGRGWR